MRRAAALALLAGAAEAETEPRILRAELAEPTDRYAHAVLGGIECVTEKLFALVQFFFPARNFFQGA